MEMKSQIMMRFLRCHICSETLVDPVSLNCNHSFCKSCLIQYLNQAECRNCAVCKRELPKETPGINISLKELADAFAGRPQLDKTKKQDVVCGKHPKKPTWFCVDEGVTWCEECQHPLQHAGHQLKRVKEAVEKVKTKLHSSLELMEAQLDDCIYADDVYKDMVKHMASQRAATERRIQEEFEQLHQWLREEEEARLTAVREEEEQKRKLIDRELDIIQGQMLALENSIHQVENDLKQDNLSFLKDYKRTISRAQCLLQDPQLLSGALIDEAKHLGNLKYRVSKKLQEKVQYTPLLLDPNTAAGWVALSEDLTSVRYMTPKKDLPDNPERFMEHAIVLGSEGFTSGKHSWEVHVGDRVKWVIGVARETVDRKEDCYLKPQYGLWAIWKHGEEYHVTGKTLSVQSAPKRISVELDYERGHVSFYDSSDMSLLFRYKDRFKEKMFPYFNTQVDMSESPLQLCPIKECHAEISNI
ncbi:nuclear factor 7, brain-like [Alosa sapidissima]|uniref:nuclear factor 7, brain-like n=1 Tax=Alosa sapidissima TaxID=34773 RepID=UPI001C07EF3B|nr:nuclear factor 7, brain-like [Alosa sapidissima]